MTSVSVVVPCYGYGHLLEGCVRSILSQRGVDVEVLILDDCSPDATRSIGEALAADPRVTYRRHARNLGHLATYDQGLRWAAGDHTVLLSADDLLTEGSLARSAAVLDAHPKVGFVYGRAVPFTDGGPPPRLRRARPRVRVWAGHEWFRRRCRATTNCISSPEVMVRTRLQHDVGGYDPSLPYAGDLEMWLRLAAHADVAFLGGVDQALYRQHPTSMSRTSFGSKVVELEQRRAAFAAALDRGAHLLPDAAALRDRVQQSLAREALRVAARAYDRGRVDTTPVAALEAFAFETWPSAATLVEHRGLRWRQRVGRRWCPWLQPLLLHVAVRRARSAVAARRLLVHGA